MNINQKYKKGILINGQIVKIKNNCSFVKYDDDAIAILSHEELSWYEDVKAYDYISIGMQAEFFVLKDMRSKHQLQVALRKKGDSEWNDISQYFERNPLLDAIIIGFTEYGCFIKFIDVPFTVLLHKSNMCLIENQDVSDKFKADEIIKVYVNDIRYKCSNGSQDIRISVKISED